MNKMDYSEGIEHMQNLVANGQHGNFCPLPSFPELKIYYPGYKRNGDYRMEVCNRAIPHKEICCCLYENSSNSYEAYVRFLEAIYQNGTSIDLSQHSSIANAEILMYIIFWASLQEEINYPQPQFNGRRLPFCRYFEAVFAANYGGITLETICERCNHHGSSVPQLINTGFNLRPTFYHK